MEDENIVKALFLPFRAIGGLFCLEMGVNALGCQMPSSDSPKIEWQNKVLPPQGKEVIEKFKRLRNF